MTKLKVAFRNYDKALKTKQLHQKGTDDDYSLQ